MNMAKCPECMSRKGERNCRKSGSAVCSLCCGQTRNPESCLGCSYFKNAKPKRNYSNLSRFSIEEMDRNLELQSASNLIEGAICTWDYLLNDTLKDEAAIRVLELLLDRYFFHDEIVATTDETVRGGFDRVSMAIDTTLGDIPQEMLCKILGVILFVARRRSRGRREYLTIVQEYVGINITPGMRALS
jgi:hypothetical protein